MISLYEGPIKKKTIILFGLNFPGHSDSKESAYNAGPCSVPWVRKIPWRREGQPTPVFLAGEFRGQRRLAINNPWGRKESARTNTLAFTFLPNEPYTLPHLAGRRQSTG